MSLLTVIKFFKCTQQVQCLDPWKFVLRRLLWDAFKEIYLLKNVEIDDDVYGSLLNPRSPVFDASFSRRSKDIHVLSKHDKFMVAKKKLELPFHTSLKEYFVHKRWYTIFRLCVSCAASSFCYCCCCCLSVVVVFLSKIIFLYMLFFLRSIAQCFIQIYMNCFVSS